MDLERFPFLISYDMLMHTVRVLVYDIIARLPAPLIGAAIWALSSQSTLPRLKGALGFDKLLHFTAFFAFTAAVGLWFIPRRRSKAAVFLIAAAIGVLYGGIDEIHQRFVPGRSCDIWDWAADVLGALLGSGIALALGGLPLRFRGSRH